MKLCVSCKACRRECPTGVDMARMKIEVSAARVAKHGLSLHDRLVGYLPRYAPIASRFSWLVNRRNDSPRLMQWSEDDRRLQRAAQAAARGASDAVSGRRARDVVGQPADGPEVVLFADTFNRYFEPENIAAALAVLTAAGCSVHLPMPPDGEKRPLCCGRTFLSVGLVEQARAGGGALRRGARAVRRARRSDRRARAELHPGLSRRDSGADQDRGCPRSSPRMRCCSRNTSRARPTAGRFTLPLKPVAKQALLHGHCHQKSFAAMGAVEATLRLVPDLEVETVESSCCGMAGAFGYGADTFDVSLAMGELSLLPAVRKADATRSWSPTAPPAGTRSRTAPAASRCTSRACWR